MKKKFSREEAISDLDPAIQQLFQEMIALRTGLDEKVNTELNRSLPLGELLFDRWERAVRLGFGEGASIYDSALVYGNVIVGKSTWIGPNVILDGSGGLTIGKFCSISAGVHIYSHNTIKWALSGGKAAYEYYPTSIGNHCFIGPQSIIQNGVTIGDNCLIAANSFISKDVPPRSIVGGSPGKILGKVVIDEGNNINLEYF
jgi:acetyltransferase-like isoleucine patch superfamily enzyme